MDFKPVSIITLLGAAQGLFLTITLLAWRKGNRRANVVLSLTFALMTLALWNAFLNTSGLYRNITATIRLYDALRLLTGPLIYLYVREMVVRPLRGRDWLHVLPAVINVVWLIPFFFSSDAVKIQFMEQTLEGISQEYVLFSALRPWYTLVYIGVSLRLLHDYSRRIRERFATLEPVSLQWLWNIVLGLAVLTFFIALAGIGAVLGIIRPNQINHAIAIVAAFWMYGLAYFALQQTVVYSSELRQLLAEPITAPPLAQAAQKLLRETPFQTQRFLLQQPMFPQEIRGERASIVLPNTELPNTDEAQMQNLSAVEPAIAEYVEHLKRYMEDHKPYLDNQLNLQKLSDVSGIPAYKISELLNQHIGYNFFNFVNRHRVEEWKRLVRENPTAATIQELAFQVGFNSKSSFNAAFKKHTGQTPSEYRAGLM